MKLSRIATAFMATMAASAIAGGPLYIHEPTMQPYKWDTSNGPIPVYTDGGRLIEDKNGNLVQTYSVLEAGTTLNHDLTLPDGTVIPAYTPVERDVTYVTVDKANEATVSAIAQWTNVETSTFAMTVQGTIEEQLGISDVNGSNYQKIYDKENGYGFWVTYDTDGEILQNYFGVSRDQVLGIAFPEWANEETGEIIEGTALMNGYFVDSKDPNLANHSGVFTHEFGHAINMSHSQANGHLVYMARGYSPQYDGVPGCQGTNTYTGPSLTMASHIETMFPFIDVRSAAGAAQSSVNISDDKVNLSDLYPTEAYKTQYGSISGTLRTKEGVEYSGVNIVARNIDNPYEDVITQQAGNMSQGLSGPDGTFTINGLTPGDRYAVYLETIKAGGYPTRPTSLVSVAEYWNDGESANPASDDVCEITPIVAQAGQTTQADIYFNGYTDGIQYTPLVEAFVMDHAKNGKRALGTTQSGMIFIYDSTDKNLFTVPLKDNGKPALHASNVAMNKTATRAAGVSDFNGDGVKTPALWDIQANKLTPMDDPSNGTCTLGSSGGVSSASVWDMNDKGDVVVGTFREATSGEAECQAANSSMAVPAIWNNGKVTPLKDNIEFVPATYGNTLNVAIKNDTGDTIRTTAWIRADRVSGNGDTVTGMTNGFGQVAWVNGQLRDIYTEFGASDSTVISQDGQYVAFGALNLESRYREATGIKLWDTQADTISDLGSLRWCEDVDYISRWTNFCDMGYDHESLVAAGAGVPRVTLLDANEDLSIITARAGSLLSGGFKGAIYIEGLGWMTMGEFFGKQGVVEASQFVMDNPFGLSANGSELFGGYAGAQITFDVDMDKAYVCQNGTDQMLSFPKQVVQAVTNHGAQFGRCDHLNDSY
ncbi:carboxypeptidase-like regulatory domain-containing protein [Salinimonas iocasae]|uniref:Carboxypeptidase regulatory-like domain-containing protein n=1 Tax=Salinimonas iocasae TaxID=2572577 RepID=A0A5B7YDE9_9ALTE|nr:carboxypeptidase-like regulatory domain-containing protein [Salinimonas iocasae]QCZ93293.1 carboxypeptidase regulatory-like domain-containing protein [Salinimonas iocasae]